MPNIFEQPGSPLVAGALILFSQKASAASVAVAENISVVQIDSTANAVALNLPAAAEYKDRVIVFSLLVDPNAHNATITPLGADTVGATTNKALTAAGKFAVVQSDGVSDWKLILAN